MSDDLDLDTSEIKEWRSIVTLIVFILTNLVVLFPFRIPTYVPKPIFDAFLKVLVTLRLIPPTRSAAVQDGRRFIRSNIPMNFVTAPILADLFLLAIHAISRQEVHDGTVGANHIAPLDIMAFFISLAYIAISIDASGLIRWLAFKVLQKGGKHGHRLFFYLYVFFFTMASLVGNDPIVLSGTAFLAYMTRVSSNIKDPKAWIYAQFAVANIGSAVLVSSNPTNLVLAGAFHIKFITYTANIIVPVIATIVLLFPALLYVLFRKDGLVPKTIQIHDLPDGIKNNSPINPNIPRPSPTTAEDDEIKALLEILNPYLDKPSAIVGSLVMGATLITILVLNASSQKGSEHPVFWVTVPAAVSMLCWDVGFGWVHRHDSRRLAKQRSDIRSVDLPHTESRVESFGLPVIEKEIEKDVEIGRTEDHNKNDESHAVNVDKSTPSPKQHEVSVSAPMQDSPQQAAERSNLQSLLVTVWLYLRQTFPTTTTVLRHLPIKLIPFALAIFILVQALVTRGWVAVFAHGWSHWVNRTGVVGAIGGMAFLSVVLCNFAGTNIGTTILLCRVIQAWVELHERNGTSIPQRTFWATVYSMAIGVNYGAFSTAFSASLAGLLWRDILARRNIHVRSRDFALVNLPIITYAMVIGCAVLVGQVYITRSQEGYDSMP